ncbi:MAG: cardiolipin synthase B [Lysobacterales bacterium]|jgi:cardiolipin synthase|nr:MAG: cardiolipin synthase B [Xanthomonadales bacterium]
MAWTKRRWFAALAGALVAIVGTVFALNFTTSEAEIEKTLRHRYGIDDPQFRRELGILLGPPIVDGNRIEDLQNGVEIFPAMLDAIRQARSTITFETYIYWSGEIGRQFSLALAERARQGVRVHVLLDWAGSQNVEQSVIDELKAAGAELHFYHPLHWYNLARMNNRTHRKLLVVDGRVGFTGGVGIRDDWQGDGSDGKHWRDSHYRLDGPGVAQLQAAFIDNWIKATGEVLQGPGYFPQLEPVGTVLGQVFTSSPEGGGDSMQLMYLLSLTAAERTIDIAAAYFVPDALTRRALVAALERGVRVRIIVPGPYTDAEIVRKASRADWGSLLEAGAEIYEFQPAMFHCKALIVDSLLVSVGSTNIDNRSFRLNDEANLNVYDRGFAEEVERVFEADLARSRRVTHDEWLARPWRERVLEQLSSVFASQL